MVLTEHKRKMDIKMGTTSQEICQPEKRKNEEEECLEEKDKC
jgi:hypothetical protein